jgi:RimJ/RimL family protein N-acetyltransferase
MASGGKLLPAHGVRPGFCRCGRLSKISRHDKTIPAQITEGTEFTMIVPLKPGVTLPQLNGPFIETGRLKLRMWQESDIAPNTAMLADPDTARFITVDGKPVINELVGWRNAAVMSGHWALHGFGYFVVEEKSTGRFAGRVGSWFPPGWPGFEIGWGIASEFRGKGYAVEAERASIDWTFATFEIDRIIHCIDRENTASQAVAQRLGAANEHEIDLFGHLADLWVASRDAWQSA